MIDTVVYNATNKPTELEKGKIINFLHKHLEEYGDPKEDISNCLSYALKERVSFGGFVLVSLEGSEITGAVVINKTGMNGYIPENILVYIATHKDYRGKGIGKVLMEKSISLASGDIALHVEKDNPAKFLYEKYGFTNPYIEMRLKRS
jgi:ribosomal protein S18 acetylase RimI-like enzyme